MDLVKIFGSNMEIGDSYIHVRDENRNETEENRRFSAFFGFFAETFQVSPLEPLLTAPYRRVRTSNRRGNHNPNVRRIGCAAAGGETHEALFQGFSLAASRDASSFLLAIQYYVLTIKTAIVFGCCSALAERRTHTEHHVANLLASCEFRGLAQPLLTKGK